MTCVFHYLRPKSDSRARLFRASNPLISHRALAQSHPMTVHIANMCLLWLNFVFRMGKQLSLRFGGDLHLPFRIIMQIAFCHNYDNSSLMFPGWVALYIHVCQNLMALITGRNSLARLTTFATQGFCGPFQSVGQGRAFKTPFHCTCNWKTGHPTH